jgi:hypothetical protein
MLAALTPLLLASPAASAQTYTEDLLISAIDGEASDAFGTAVATSGGTTLVGSLSDIGFIGGAVYVVDTATGRMRFKLRSLDGAQGDQFGTSVAISGAIAVIGANSDDDVAMNAGSAYVFDTTTGRQLRKLTASDPEGSNFFGLSVAISGSTALVSAPFDDDAGNNSGSAYLFDVDTGQQLFKLTAADASANALFGSSVALSGSTAIIGARGADGVGAAYLFDTSTGQQSMKLTANDPFTDDRFGDAVAIDGTLAIVGATRDDDNGDRSGSAYVFDTVTGAQLFKLTAPDGAADDSFGTSVAISGSHAIVGAIQNLNGGAGSAYIYDLGTGQLVYKLVASNSSADDQFGTSVAISGGTLVVGAFRGDGVEPDSGAAYVSFLSANVTQQPQPAIVANGETAVFEVAVSNPAVATYQWRRNGVALSDGGNISGAQSETLQIVASPADVATYDCVVTGIDGPATSAGAILAVQGGGSPNDCLADLNLDDLLDLSDITTFVESFLAGCP